jgi:hypothetical protein
LWDDCDAHIDKGVAAEPDWDGAVQPAPGYEAKLLPISASTGELAGLGVLPVLGVLP